MRTLRRRIILRAHYDQLHAGMKLLAEKLNWEIVDELPENRARVVTLESLGLVQPEEPVAVPPVVAVAMPPEMATIEPSEHAALDISSLEFEHTVPAPPVFEDELEPTPRATEVEVEPKPMPQAAEVEVEPESAIEAEEEL